jgi:hypothetical protein
VLIVALALRVATLQVAGHPGDDRVDCG